MNEALASLISEAQSLGYGISLTWNPEKNPGLWSGTLFGGFGKLKLRGYACKHGQTPEEALGLALAEVKTPHAGGQSALHDVDAMLADLGI